MSKEQMQSAAARLVRSGYRQSLSMLSEPSFPILTRVDIQDVKA
jgi:hypothetical protein